MGGNDISILKSSTACEWINKFIPHFTGHVIIYPCWWNYLSIPKLQLCNQWSDYAMRKKSYQMDATSCPCPNTLMYWLLLFNKRGPGIMTIWTMIQYDYWLHNSHCFRRIIYNHIKIVEYYLIFANIMTCKSSQWFIWIMTIIYSGNL